MEGAEMFRDPTIYREGLFAGQAAFITGATGIGLAIAGELRLLGADVFLASRKEENLTRGKERLLTLEAPGRVEYHVCNIREREAIDQAVDFALSKFGRIDMLVNNAGGQFPAPALTMSRKGWDAVIETNLTGTFQMSQAVVEKCMAEKKSGAIVNIIAQMWNGFPLMAHTGASRAGVDNLTKTLAFEWAQYGVRVNAVAPGVILSSGIENYAPEFQKAFQDSIKFIAAGRLGTPREVAAAVVFLLSPAAGFITGTTLRVDGGEPLCGSSAAGQVREIIEPVVTVSYE
jgi:NAD(P)-dependent dehydrogenase (short-subunit alcohol dehydrogenase family)